MKGLISASIVALILAAPALADEHSMLARVTVYWPGEGQPFACWNGARLREGHCAVDPKKIPYGSKVLFTDATCVAVDTGPAVVSRKAARACGRTASERKAIVVDRFFESKQQARSWEKAHPHFMTVRVVTPEKRSKGNAIRIATKDPSAFVLPWNPFQTPMDSGYGVIVPATFD
jgi:3D (Asp-Asp-Asp) domain-containing protein